MLRHLCQILGSIVYLVSSNIGLFKGTAHILDARRYLLGPLGALCCIFSHLVHALYNSRNSGRNMVNAAAGLHNTAGYLIGRNLLFFNRIRNHLRHLINTLDHT